MFGLKYSGEFFSQYENIHWRVEIAQRGYNGDSEDLEFVTNSDPLILTWERQGDEFYVPIKASEVSLTINCKTNFQYLELFTLDPRFFRVSIYRNTKLYWRGFLVSDLYTEQFSPPPYDVEIKAVDGFNLLNSMLFTDEYGAQFKDQKLSLWQIIEKCYTVLELDLDIADWSNILTEGMDVAKSPLSQILLETNELYLFNDKLTYREALEFAISPFAYQMFQSNGALHIRSVKSLYESYRPLSYHNTSGVNHIITHAGNLIKTHLDTPLISNVFRERIESMWSDFYVQSTATLEIVPPIKDITITSKNKCTQDIAANIGVFQVSQWQINDGFSLDIKDSKIYIEEIFNHPADVLRAEFKSSLVEKTSFPIQMKFVFECIRDYGTMAKILLYCNNETEKMYFNGDDWVGSNDEESLYKTIEITKGSYQSTLEYNLPNVPFDGYISLKYTNHNGKTLPTNFTFSLVIENEHYGLIEKSLTSEYLVNISNNTHYEISAPIIDVPAIPNSQYVYNIRYIDKAGAVPELWKKAGSMAYKTLSDMMYESATKLRGLPAKKISGEMHTKRHVDMNTVLLDDKFLNVGFYVNSLSINAYNDNCNCELVEMPRLLANQKEGAILQGLDVLEAVIFKSNVLYISGNDLRFFIVSDSRDIFISSFSNITGIYGGVDNCYAICDDQVFVINYRGQVINKYKAFLPANILEGQTEELPFTRIDDYGGDAGGIFEFDFFGRTCWFYDFRNEQVFPAYSISSPIKYARNIIAINDTVDGPHFVNMNVGVNDISTTNGQPILDIGNRYIITLEQITALTQVVICRKFKFLKINPNIIFSLDSKYSIFAVSNSLVAVSDGKSVKVFYEDMKAFSDIAIEPDCGNVVSMVVYSDCLYVICNRAILKYNI